MTLLPATYFPDHDENRMHSEGDLRLARARFIEERPSNLVFLLRQRYEWMNPYLDGLQSVFELGAGAGFSPFFLKNKNLKLTDVSGQPWVDRYADALKMPFENASVDALVCSHMIHHVATPVKFFAEAERVLKPGGLIVISDIYTSFLMRFLLRLMRHEGWSYDVNVFDEKLVANDPRDPWSANCAIPELLFASNEKFEASVPGFRVLKNERTECLIFPLSGGVIAKTKTVNLPFWLLNVVNGVDSLLIRLFPKFFAMGMRVVLQKK